MPVLDEMAVVRIPYVNTYADRYGTVRRYFRKRGCKPVALPGTPGSAEFMDAYRAALGESAPMPGSRHGVGTVAALICDYLKTPAFTDLAASSKTLYRTILDRFGGLHGHRMVHDMPRAKVAAYIFRIGADHPAMANVTKAVLRKLLAHAVRAGYRNDNPVAEIDRYKGGTRHTWTEAELAAFEHRWPLGTRERLAYALLLYTGQCSGDVVKMRRADISGGAIAVVQKKTGTALSIPIHHEPRRAYHQSACRMGCARRKCVGLPRPVRPPSRSLPYPDTGPYPRSSGTPTPPIRSGYRVQPLRS
jgi:hypothetical protein